MDESEVEAQEAEADFSDGSDSDDEKPSKSKKSEEIAMESRRIDDPVRMYLTQMGEIPLLTRERRDRAGQEDRADADALSGGVCSRTTTAITAGRRDDPQAGGRQRRHAV